MLYNVIDHRKRHYRWKNLKAVIEPTNHDNTVKDSDPAPPLLNFDLVCEDKNGISLNEAIKWANEQIVPVTLYLYDFVANEEE